MGLEHYREEDARQVRRMETAITRAILPFSANTDPHLAVIALMRCVRQMLAAGSEAAQKELRPVLVAFLEGKPNLPGSAAGLWLPPHSRN